MKAKSFHSVSLFSAGEECFFMKIFFQKHKYHLIILAELLILAGVSAYYAYREPTPIVIGQSAPIAVTMRLEQPREERAELPSGSTVFTLMETLQKNGQLSFRAKNFGGALGKFIDAINEVKNDSDHFWIYYINDEKARVGVSNYTLQAGDIITWKYETEKDI